MQFERRLSELIADVQLIGADDSSWPIVPVKNHLNIAILNVPLATRKQRMVELSDAFIALPGGIGTLDELFETWTWLQLGIHSKPVGLLNVAGYYDPLLAVLRQISGRKFMSEKHLACLLVETDADRLLAQLDSFRTPGDGKWVAVSKSLQP